MEDDESDPGDEQYTRIKTYWEHLFLLADTEQNIVGDKIESLTSKCLYEILKIALQNSDIELIRCCVSLGLPLDDDTHFGITPLMMAIDTNNAELVKEIITLGANVNKMCRSWDSPLHYCVLKNKMKAAEALLKVGSTVDLNVDILGSDGQAPLHKAAKLHLKEMIILLVKNGANINVRGEHGLTPLHVASSSTGEPCA